MDCFKYHGSQMAADGGYERDIVHRINEGYRAWGALKSVLSNRVLGIKAKKCLYEGVILPMALYGAEAWGCGIRHMASFLLPHPRTTKTTICSTSSLLLLNCFLCLHLFYCCKRLLGRNNTGTISAPHQLCRHLFRGALPLTTA